MEEIPLGLIGQVASEIASKTPSNRRLVVALAGPPATGKTTFSDRLSRELNLQREISSVVVPMDGFHLDNTQLARLHLLDRKGCPESFDVWGFALLLSRLRNESDPIYFPTFDRKLDRSVAGAGVVLKVHNVILVEGNYLLLDEEPWSGLSQLFDYTIYLDTPFETLKERLVRRWLCHDHTAEQAESRALTNDIPNAERVCKYSRSADRVLRITI